APGAMAAGDAVPAPTRMRGAEARAALGAFPEIDDGYSVEYRGSLGSNWISRLRYHTCVPSDCHAMRPRSSILVTLSGVPPGETRGRRYLMRGTPFTRWMMLSEPYTWASIVTQPSCCTEAKVGWAQPSTPTVTREFEFQSLPP